MTNACIYVEYDVGPAVFTEKVVRARTQHVCVECGETIQPGSMYQTVRGKWDGEWRTYKTCARCANIRSDFFESWEYGGCVNAFIETHGFNYLDGLPKDFAPCTAGEGE